MKLTQSGALEHVRGVLNIGEGRRAYALYTYAHKTHIKIYCILTYKLIQFRYTTHSCIARRMTYMKTFETRHRAGFLCP